MNAEKAYFLLDAHSGMTPSQLKKQYYKKALLCHPDKNGNVKEFHEINKAYEYLSQTPDPILPSLFESSIVSILATMDASVLLSLYVLFMDFQDIIPPMVFDEIRRRMPPIIIIRPTLLDLIHHNVYLYTHGTKRYSIPMWHHELIYDDFIVLCIPEVELDDDNNLTYTIHAKVQEVFEKGLWIETLLLLVPAEKLKMVPYQVYSVKGTIPKVNQTDIYSVLETGLFILNIYLS
jgi:hypothetical protein